jgi:hypothetical protein
MALSWIHWIARTVLIHPYLAYLLGFLAPVVGAYWLFGVAPYTRSCPERLLSPWHVRRPSVPGVLERYASWDWAAEDQLTPFGRWLLQELERRDETLEALIRRAGLDLHTVASALYPMAGERADPLVIRRLAALVGAGEDQIQGLQQAQRAAISGLKRLP